MSSMVLITCDCKHEYQDEKYGKNRRIANKKYKGNTATCTVCGKERVFKSSDELK